MAIGASDSDLGTSSGGVITIAEPVSGLLAAAGTTPESLLYGRTVVNGDSLSVASPANRDGGGTGTVSVDTLGVPTVTGSYGTYAVNFSFKGAASETEYVAHGDIGAVEALFTTFTRDAEGYTVITPEATSRLLYVDNTEPNDTTAGPDADSANWYTLSTLPTPDDWENPGAVNAYQTIAGALAAMRADSADWIILKAGQTHDVSAAVYLQGGSSNTARSCLTRYGAGTRPSINQTDRSLNDTVSIEAGINYVNVVSIAVYPITRNPAEGSFIGYGLTDSTSGIRVYSGPPGSSQTGILIEDCEVSYCVHNIGLWGTGNLSDGIVRRCILSYAFHEKFNTHAQGIWANSNSILIEDNILYHNGWLIQSDGTTYSHEGAQNGVGHTGTQDGGTSSTTLTDSAQDWSGATLAGVIVENLTTGASGVASANGTTTITVTLTGGSRQDFQNGDSYRFNATESHGQATLYQHNMYLSALYETIIRNNIIGAASSIAVKLSMSPVSAAEQLSGDCLLLRGYDIIEYNNLVFEGEIGLGTDSNNTNKNGPRYKDYRSYNNAQIDIGSTQPTNRSLAFGHWLLDCKDGFIGRNVCAKQGTATITNIFGILFDGTMDGTIVSRNFIHNIGAATGSSGNNTGCFVIQDPEAAENYANLKIIGNYFQNTETDDAVIGEFPSSYASSFTFTDNKYYTDRTTNEWAVVDDTPGSLAAFISTTSETGSSSDAKTIIEARTIETYQTSLAATATKAAFMTSALAQIKGSWDTDYEAKYVVAYIQAGYKE